MLTALELKDFAIVDELRVELGPGLNVLTGETGAGKSILIDALGLLIGGRADNGLIRTGAQSALIQGIFAGGPFESAARRLQSSGRTSARLDGELVTIGELAEAGAELVAIHGQHASQTLLDAAEQRKLLDRLLPEAARQVLWKYGENFRQFQAVSKELDELRAATRERARRLDILQYQLDEIDAAGLKPDEDDELQEQAESLRHGERIVQGTAKALDKLTEADVNAVDLLAEALRDLEGAGRYNRTLETLAAELSDSLSGLQAISQEVEGFLADFDAEPGKLERIESRLAQLERLKHKYGDSLEAVLRYRQEISEELDELAQAESNLSGLEKRQTELETALDAAAKALSQARAKAAATLSEQVSTQIRPLGMPNAEFSVQLEPLPQLGAYGRDKVTFLFSANLGEPPAPLAAVASGGELSRVMLGLNVVTGSDLPTLAFDEVDAGIGGQTARAVGALLKKLAADHQVLVVTHLPQVAAFADQQFYVEKQEKGGRTVTRVTRLEPEGREAELARMLSGAVTDTALAHARELLSETQATHL